MLFKTTRTRAIGKQKLALHQNTIVEKAVTAFLIYPRCNKNNNHVCDNRSITGNR